MRRSECSPDGVSNHQGCGKACRHEKNRNRGKRTSQHEVKHDCRRSGDANDDKPKRQGAYPNDCGFTAAGGDQVDFHSGVLNGVGSIGLLEEVRVMIEEPSDGGPGTDY